MPLIVENGTGVPDANSFATLEQARSFATDRGVTLPADGTLTAYLVKATDYLKSLSYQGTKKHAGEEYLPWPRTGLTLDDEDFADTVIPRDILNAACQLCIEQFNGVELAPTATGAAVKREKVGPLETEYAGSSRPTAPRMPLVDAYLAGWVVARGMRLSVGRA